MSTCNIQFHLLEFTLPVAHNTTTLPQFFTHFFGLQIIDPDEIRQPKGRNGYLDNYALKSEHGGELISVSCRGNGNLKNTTHIQIHGAALDTGNIDVQDIAKKMVALGGWGTGAHVALDDFGEKLNWDAIKECCKFDNFRDRLITRLCKPSKDKKTGEHKQNEPLLLTGEGETCYIGQKGSDTRIVFYTRRGSLRCELRLAGRAQVTDLLTRIAAGEPIGPLATGILRHNLMFVEGGMRRKDRRPVCQWWLDFLGNCEALALSRKRSAKQRSPWYETPSRTDWLKKQAQKELNGTRFAETLAMLHAVVANAEAEDNLRKTWK